MKSWRTDLDNMVYLIRDEGIKSLELIKTCQHDKLVLAQRHFMSGLSNMFSRLFSNARVVRIDLEEQLQETREKIGNRKTISLDTYYKGNYNIETTRMFKMVDGKSEFVSMTNRPGYETLESQIEKIKPGEYIIVDDDAVGGRTIREVKSKLAPGVDVVGTYLMMESYKKEGEGTILDVVDCRDFIVGSTGGLTVQLKTGGIVRAPYMQPFVDIEDKANVPNGLGVEVSKQILDLNIQFWSVVDANMCVGGMGESIKELSKYLGIPYDTNIIDACNLYKVLSEKGVLL